MNTAIISPNKLQVVYSIRVDVNREFLQTNVLNGWDDVKNLTNKVLTYEGRDFTFSGWNSDSNDVYFYRILNHSNAININSRVATIH